MRPDYDQIFAERGAGYHQQMARQPMARQQEFSSAVAAAALRPGDTVLDFPSGGAYLNQHLPAGVRYVAVESCAVFHRYATQRVGTRAILVPNLTATGLADASVDRIISISGLHHLDDRLPVYRELVRLLKPGGIALLADVQAGSPIGDFLNGFVDRHNVQGHQGHFLDQRDLALAQQAGLQVCSAELAQYHWQFPSMAAALDYCRGLFGISATDSELLTALQALGLQECRLEDQAGLLLPWQLLHLKLQKPGAPH